MVRWLCRMLYIIRMKSFFTTKFHILKREAKQSKRSVANAFLSKVPVACLAVFTAGIVFAGGAFADNKDLDRLEMKFFHHTKPKLETSERLERLEKMFFGEGKEGPVNERLNNLKKLVPDLDEVELERKKREVKPKAQAKPQLQSQTPSTASSSSSYQAPSQSARDLPRADEGTSYPAITAIEKRKLGKTYEGEAVSNRLGRLEKKIFGKVSSSNDFTDRMDRLKVASGVDVTREAPLGSDWAADDVVVNYPTPSHSRPRQTIGRPKYGEDGKTFSGRNLREDMRRAFGNRTPSSSGSGYYGMNSSRTGSTGSGAYGFGGSSSGGSRAGVGIIPNDRTTAYAPPGLGSRTAKSSNYPPVAPPINRSTSRPLGLNQQVDLLESQIFGRSFANNSLPERVARLEKTVFPNSRVNSRASLPSRVSKLVSVVPINSANLISNAQRAPQAPYTQPQTQNNQVRRPSGLSKVLSAMGNFVTGGFNVGSYPMAGNLITDPQTGMYLDRTTGNLIDPHTGMVVGRRGLNGYNNLTPGYGYQNRSFNNGFSPSMNSYGIGGTGIRFGTGFGGVGGMWP